MPAAFALLVELDRAEQVAVIGQRQRRHAARRARARPGRRSGWRRREGCSQWLWRWTKSGGVLMARLTYNEGETAHRAIAAAIHGLDAHLVRADRGPGARIPVETARLGVVLARHAAAVDGDLLVFGAKPEPPSRTATESRGGSESAAVVSAGVSPRRRQRTAAPQRQSWAGACRRRRRKCRGGGSSPRSAGGVGRGDERPAAVLPQEEREARFAARWAYPARTARGGAGEHDRRGLHGDGLGARGGARPATADSGSRARACAVGSKKVCRSNTRWSPGCASGSDAEVHRRVVQDEPRREVPRHEITARAERDVAAPGRVLRRVFRQDLGTGAEPPQVVDARQARARRAGSRPLSPRGAVRAERRPCRTREVEHRAAQHSARRHAAARPRRPWAAGATLAAESTAVTSRVALGAVPRLVRGRDLDAVLARRERPRRGSRADNVLAVAGQPSERAPRVVARSVAA